ncbi:unnamed protein product [Cyprideis torosa]|uniref:Uncharacterized protein n=1 Tax=Cyprideis torosa TaxID=163714 RepID=A0A7R8WAT1_9CRUS|nr:unnamed protein product [Cyprideis torosa]CAG0888734.1 unnamed protein product [Cyprideis torosa]
MAQSLTPEQRKTFEEVFSIFDERGQGKIKTTDFKNVLLCLGMELTNKELEDIINEIDRDVKFGKAMAQSLTPEQRKTFEEVFSIFDERGQGKIKTTDFKNVLLCLGMELTNKELEDIINEIDRDGTCPNFFWLLTF